VLVLKTDHRDYFQDATARVAAPAVSALFAVEASSADFWNDAATRAHAATRPFAGEATLYEERFRRKRKPIYYLEMRRRRARPEGGPHP
jgi:tRNA G46 methylase TrmB